MTDVKSEIWNLSDRAGEEVPVALKHRLENDDLILFLHGLGCCKESFDEAFETPQLSRYSLCSFDFPSHGESAALDGSADISTFAEVTLSLVERISPKRLFMVCHSMGGAVGLLAAEALPNVAGFISVEGNLVGEDCGYVSRRIAEQSTDEFITRSFPAFVATLAAAVEPSLRCWGEWYDRCQPRGLHEIARSLVEWCDSDKLMATFTKIERRSYVYGAQSDVDYLVRRLRETPSRAVTRSGHFPMLDNPGEFYSLIAELVANPAKLSAPPSLARIE